MGLNIVIGNLVPESSPYDSVVKAVEPRPSESYGGHVLEKPSPGGVGGPAMKAGACGFWLSQNFL